MDSIKIMIGMTVGLLFLFIFIVSPKYALIMLLAIRTFIDLFTYTFVVGYIGPWRFNLQTIIGAEFVLLCGAYFLMKGKLPKLSFTIPMLLFYLVSLFAIFSSHNIMKGINEWTKWLAMGLLMLLLIEVIKTKTDIDKIINAGAFASIVPIAVSCYGIISRKGTGIFYAPPEVAEVGWYSPGNPAGLVLMSVLPFILFNSLNYNNKYSKIFLFLLIGAIVGIFFTFMRTAWIALLLFLVTLSMLKGWARYLIFFTAFMVAMTFLSPSVQEVLKRRTTDIRISYMTGDYRSLGDGRLHIWMSNIEYWYNLSTFNKFFGAGVGNNVFATGDYGSHNDFIMLLVDTGLIGLFFYSIFLFRLFKSWIALLKISKENYYRNLAYCGIPLFIAFISMSFTNGQLPMLQSQLYVAGFLALGPAALRILRTK